MRRAVLPVRCDRRALKSEEPSSRRQTASPSMMTLSVGSARIAFVIAGKASVQLLPLRDHRRIRLQQPGAPARRDTLRVLRGATTVVWSITSQPAAPALFQKPLPNSCPGPARKPLFCRGAWMGSSCGWKHLFLIDGILVL